MAMSLNSDDMAAIATAAHGRAVWYVTKGGNDANAGTADDPFLTVSQAVTAASSGDLILVGPGTYTEQVNASSKQLEIAGAGYQTKITSATAPTLQLTSNSTVRDIWIDNTESGSAKFAVSMITATLTRLERVKVTGLDQGVFAGFVSACTIDDCYIEAAEYGIQILPAAGAEPETPILIVRDSQVIADTWTTCSGAAIYANGLTNGGSVQVHHSILSGYSGYTGASPYFGSAIYAAGDIVLTTSDCLLYGRAANDAEARAVFADSGAVVHLADCLASGSGGAATYDLYNQAATLAVAGTRYDSTATVGTIENIDSDAAARGILTTPANTLDTDASGHVTVGDKTGYALASDGLDSISTTAPSGVASNFREMLVQLWRRFFGKSTMTATELKTYADNGTDVLTTQTVSEDGTTQTQGAAS